MDGIENARHDLAEAAWSVDTAIELLTGIRADGSDDATELEEIIADLMKLKKGLELSNKRLLPLVKEAAATEAVT